MTPTMAPYGTVDASVEDRFPSQLSVGLSIDIPEQSTLVLYPYDHRSVNAFNKAADFSASLQPDELPEVGLKR